MTATFKALSDFQGRIEQIVLVDASTLDRWDTGQIVFERHKHLILGLTSPQGFNCITRDFFLLAEQNHSVSSLKSHKSGLGARSRSEMYGIDYKLLEKKIPCFSYSVPKERLAFERLLGDVSRYFRPFTFPLKTLDLYELSQFVRDHFLVLSSPDPRFPVLLKSYYFWPSSNGPLGRSDCGDQLVNHFVPEILSNEIKCPVLSTQLVLQGGDILCGGDYGIIGQSILEENLKLHEKSENLGTMEGILTEFSKNLDLNAICPDVKNPEGVRLTRPPKLFHLDLFLTMVGESDGKILILVGQVHIWDGNEWVLEAETNDEGDAQKYLNTYARLLESHWPFKVARIPLLKYPLVPGDDSTNIFYSYNNCLVETDNGASRIFLPSFGANDTKSFLPNFGSADEMVKSHLIQLEWGLEPVVLKVNFRSLAGRGAGLRCITQVLRRSND